jgi:hypothetical protein
MSDPIYTPYPPVYSATQQPNIPVEVSSGLMSGGALIQNPADPKDQNLPVAEALRVDMIDSQGLLQDSITLQPGGFFRVPLNFNGVVWASSKSAQHQFSAVIIFPYVGYTPVPPQPGSPGFPGWSTGLTITSAMKVLRSYLYQQYNDDEDLQVFVMAYNNMAQAYITWFATVMIPVYARNPMISGSFLDWVGEGLYGMKRPTLASGQRRELGTFNSAMFNEAMFNEDILLDPTDIFVTDDDTYKRILTWHLYKGDGKLFNIRWLKRRVMRFLTGADGGNGESSAGDPSNPDMYPPDETYSISVTFGPNDQVNINIQSVHRSILDGAMFNAGMFNQFMFNELGTSVTYTLSSPWAPIFKSALQSGALELPFQYTFVVNIN